MSYILDALRKSEQERQKASEQGISLPYPITPKRERDSRLIPSMLFIIGIFIAFAIWQMWPGAKEIRTPITPPAPPVSTSVPSAKTDIPGTRVVSSPKPVKHKESSTQNDNRKNETLSASVSESHTKTNSDPLAGLPALEISGFIHDAQSGNLALINNTLMHDGDEVSPGLRVEKIRDDSVIFSYKGFVFIR
jgi:general secretion pathway protein B